MWTMLKLIFKVIEGHLLLCQSTQQHIHDFLLALNSNLTPIFNRSWDITPSLHIHCTPRLPGGTGSRWTCFGVQNMGLFNHKLKSKLTCTVWSQCMPIPDRQMDERHGDSATIVDNDVETDIQGHWRSSVVVNNKAQMDVGYICITETYFNGRILCRNCCVSIWATNTMNLCKYNHETLTFNYVPVY